MLIKFLSQGLVLEIVKNLGMAERLVGLVPFVPYSIQFLSQGQVLNVVKISAWLRGWLVGTMVSEAGRWVLVLVLDVVKNLSMAERLVVGTMVPYSIQFLNQG